MTLDTLIAVGIVIGAAIYLYRRFSRSRQGPGCGCASGGGCGGQKQADSNECRGSKH